MREREAQQTLFATVRVDPGLNVEEGPRDLPRSRDLFGDHDLARALHDEEARVAGIGRENGLIEAAQEQLLSEDRCPLW